MELIEQCDTSPT